MKKKGRPAKIIIPAANEIKTYAPAISETSKFIDEVRDALKDVFKLYNEKHERNPITFTINSEDMTLHFLAQNKPLECTTLRQPLKTIIAVAKKYMYPKYMASNTQTDLDEAAYMIRRNRNR